MSAMYQFKMPDDVGRALLRLQKACERNGMDMRAWAGSDGLGAFVSDRGGTRFVKPVKGKWFELREV